MIPTMADIFLCSSPLDFSWPNHLCFWLNLHILKRMYGYYLSSLTPYSSFLASDYSQCLPGGSGGGGGSTTTTAPPTSTGTPAGGLPFLGGVNLAGYDFTVVRRLLFFQAFPFLTILKYTNGSFTGTGISPPVSQISHFASQGVNIFRIRESSLHRLF